jgi:hypothetical protein
MKKLYPLLALVVSALLITIASCKGGEDVTPDTQLELTVKSTSGGVHQNAVVRLYSSFEDWINKTNQVSETQLTDSEGKVLFTNLKSEKYYWLAEKDCLNNVFGFSTSKNPIEEGKRSVVSTTIEETGTLEIINTSNDIYKVYIDNEVADNSLDGGKSRDFIAKAGTLTIRVVQQSSVVNNPIDKTYSASISCGKNTTVSFP